MADMSNIRTDITPAQITFDNIDEWNNYSEDAIGEIGSQMNQDNTSINDLINFFAQEIETHHFVGTESQMSQMSNVKSGSVFFIQKEDL